nr:replicase polyprotein [Citrus leaf blotch virus 2]
MALLSNKTAIECMLGNFEKTDIKRIYQPAVETLVSHSEFRNSHFAYSMEPFLKKKITSLGIELFPNGYMPHSHPFSKTLENHLLYDVLPGVINSDEFIFCSIKEKKVQFIKAKDNIKVLNEIIDGRDVSRYKEVQFVHNFGFSSLSDDYKFSKSSLKVLGLHKSFFFHDEVHHWTKKNVFRFLNDFQPRRLVFTVVYPPELLGGYNNSQNPKMYTFKIIKDKLFFFPDGVTSEGYEQPANLYWLFKSKYLVDGDRTWTIIRHSSKYAHHLFEIVPGRLHTESSHFYNNFDVVDMHHIFKNRFKRYDLFPVNYQHVYKVYSYLLCLKKPDLESGLAKLRQIIGDDVEIKEFLFFEQLCKRFIERGTSFGMFGHTLLEHLFLKFTNKLPNFLIKWTKTWRCNNLFDFLYDLGTLNIQVDRGTCYAHIIERFPFEVVPLDSSVFLDPLPFFLENENWNTERVDDGYLERVRIPYFNYKGDPKKKETFHVLQQQLHREKHCVSTCAEFKEPLRICWRGDDHRYVSFSKAVFQSVAGISNEKHHNAYVQTLKKVVADGEMCTPQYLEQLFDEFLHPKEYLDEGNAGEEEEDRKEREHASDFWINVEELTTKIQEESIPNVPERGEANMSNEKDEVKEEEIEGHEIEGKGEGKGEGEEVVDKSDSLDYRLMFKEVKCQAAHGEPIDVPGDGNCFFHALQHIFDIPIDPSQDREEFASFLIANGFIRLGNYIKPNAVWAEVEIIYCYARFRNIKIIVHQDDKCYEYGEGEEGHLLLRGSHFLALPMYSLKSNFESISDLPITFGERPELLQFRFVESDFNCFIWKGRRSAFLSVSPEIDYGHNGMMYPRNEWLSSFDEIIKICDPKGNYNAALIQFYDAGSDLGYHRDNEKVYLDDPILTVNLCGVATFSLEFRNDIREIEMCDASFLIMPKGMQKQARHKVHAHTQRVSITFRYHVRSMNGNLIGSDKSEFDAGKNICLIQAVADGLKSDVSKIKRALESHDRAKWGLFFKESSGATLFDCRDLAKALKLNLEVHCEREIKVMDFGQTVVKIKFENQHFSLLKEFVNLPRSSFSHKQSRGNVNVTAGLVSHISNCEHYNELQFNAEAEKFLKLRKSFLQRTTGILLGEVLDNGGKFFKEAHGLALETKNISCSYHCLTGFAGSGKSRVMQDWLKGKKKGNFVVVSPRVTLMHDWLLKLNLEPKDSNKVCTFESFIKKEKKNLELIVLDEMTLFPNGYLDWLTYELTQLKSNAEVVLIFDPLQARYHNESDVHLLDFEHDVDTLIGEKELKYLYGSFRLNGNFHSQFWENLPMPKKDESDGKIWVISNPDAIRESFEDRDQPDVVLVDSRVEKKAYETQFRTLTFGESQGLTFNHVCIVLSESTAASNELRWMVALTRAKERVSFCVSHLGGIDDFLIACKSELPKTFLRKEAITKRKMQNMSRAKLLFYDLKFGCGVDEIDREERLSGDPFLKPYIFLGQRINKEKVAINEIEPQEPKCQTHLFISEPNFAQCYNFDLIRLKEEREYREDMLVTDQFCDSYNKRGPRCNDNTVGPVRFKAIYPKHSHDDDMTFWMAVKKRLVFREENENRSRLNDAHLIGGLLYNNFKRCFKLDFQHDQWLLEKCRNDFEIKKLQKSQATIRSHSIRSDIDWALNDVFLFMKSQLCTKFEKQFCDAKAGQTLACFQHLILVQFAPWCRYLEAQIREQLPEEIYIHSNKNFDDLNKWVKKFFMRDICVESDYEAFDACQDEYILSFEIHLMKDAGFPDEVIDAYIDLKCKLGCKLGHFAVMRFTGEFCTFLFNTLANIAFTMCRYEWREGQPIAFAGDDMCALNNLPLRYDFEEIFERISLKAKVERTERPMFCGWRLTPYGIVKEPELVYNRFQIAIEEGKVLECLENYAIEVSYAYSLSERLYEVLKSERQIQYHQAVVRFIVTHLDKLKTKVKLLFEEQSSDEEI